MSDYCFDATHGDEVGPKSECAWCLRERIKELEAAEKQAAEHVLAMAEAVASVEAENQRLLRHLNRMNDIMCDALAGTTLLGGGENG